MAERLGKGAWFVQQESEQMRPMRSVRAKRAEKRNGAARRMRPPEAIEEPFRGASA
jgi:hypothetical protein